MTRRDRKLVGAVAAPPMPEERVERLWQGVGRLHRTQRRRAIAIRVGGAALVLALVSGLSLHLRARSSTITADPGTFDLRTGKTQDLTLADGTRLEVGDHTRLVRTSAHGGALRFRLDGGSVLATLPATGQSELIIETASAEVRGTSGSYSVRVDEVNRRTSVEVAAGEVRLLKADHEIARLGSGQTWISDASEPTPPPSAIVAPPSPPSPPSASAPSRPQPPADQAEQLFERADKARLEGRPAEAARLFDEYRNRYPSSGNAGLAAFEAGRIHLTTGAYRPAAEAFSFAVRHGDSTFREDAEANLVEAWASAGDAESCRKARDAYLEHYPRGALRSRVGSRCP